MKKKLVLALAALVTFSAIGLGSTLALFSDAKSGDVTLTAGTLCLTSERNDGEPVPGPMFYITPDQGKTPGGVLGTFPTGLWAPGDTNVRTLTVYNPASCSAMDAWLDSVQATMHPGGDAVLADKLWVEIYTPNGTPDEKIAEGWLSQFLAGPMPLQYPGGGKVPLLLTANRHLKFIVHLDIGTNNDYQDKSLVVDFTVFGSQKDNNP